MTIFNNTVTLTGNTGSDVKIIETGDTRFAKVSLATTDAYQDEAGTWQNKETVWHTVLAFGPKVIDELKTYKKGSRIKVTGSISYRPFEVITEEGGTITKYEAAIIAGKVEAAPLSKKEAA